MSLFAATGNLLGNGMTSNRTGPKEGSQTLIAAWNRVFFQACLRHALTYREAGCVEEVLRWCAVGGWFASRGGWFGDLGSPELEAELLRAAENLPRPARTARNRSRSRWLHVLSEAYGTLGHTNLCRRWLEYDTQVVHDVILVDQKSGAPSNLVAAAQQSGGRCVVLDAASPMLKRAEELRAYAWQDADVVVLHTHPEEVIATVAFGVPGGPPVLLVNHADHSFWVGCAVADLVLDIRESGHLWTKVARGVDRALILPLPLAQGEADLSSGVPERKQRVRTELGIAQKATVFLTVGAASKYEPVPGMNFVEAAMRILLRCPKAHLIAVGPEDAGDWKAARRSTGGRLRAWGRRPDSTRFCQAADVYLEGFPAGSLTALLEAGEAGLACVRAPRACIPPYASDGVGLDEMEQPRDVEDYVQRAVELAQAQPARAALGQNLRRAIRAEHCGEGWLTRLREVKNRIPECHAVYPDFRPMPVEPHRRDWLIRYLHRNDPQVRLSTIAEEAFVEAWKLTTGEPRIDEALWAKLKGRELDASQEPAERSSALRFRDRVSLWWLNRRIRSRGLRERLVTNARLALANNKTHLARKLTYSCLVQRVSSLGDLAWLKMLIKAHVGRRFLGRLKRLRKGAE